MLGHVHPDADVLGTLLALGMGLEERGWSVVYGGPHSPPEVLRFLPGISRYQRLESVPGRFDVAVLTDCPNPARTQGLLEEARRVTGDIVNIDHHPDNRRYGHLNWVDPSAAATGELIYELLGSLGVPLTPAMATNLYTAIHTDTGSFRYSNVTARTFRIASDLVEHGAAPAVVSGFLYEQRAGESLGWLGEVLRQVRLSEDGRVAWVAIPEGLVPETFLESEDLVNYPRSIASVRVACLLRERDGGAKVSLRGKGQVDVSRIAAEFGGGGHPNAAGCTIAGDFEEIVDRVVSRVRQAVGQATSEL
jgi:phosphoesterase RecJ-like protein